MRQKIVFTLCACLLFAFVQAQTPYAFKHTRANPTGAVVNTGIDTTSASIPGLYEILIITPVVTKVSGTVGGNCILEFSGNGTSWVTAVGDTLALTNVATQFKNFILTKDPYLFYRIRTVGTGTMSATVSVTYAAKRF